MNTHARVFILLCSLAALGGCSALSPITTALSIGEASEAVRKDREQPSTIETVVRKDGGTVVVQSDSDKSMVGLPELELDQSPGFDIEKAVDGIPTWLVIFNTILGILVFINTWRSYKRIREVDL